jgi:hypothetical protein
MIGSDNGSENSEDALRSRRGILLVDVETTGLPRGGDFSSCRLVQIAMLLCDAVTQVHVCMYVFI